MLAAVLLSSATFSFVFLSMCRFKTYFLIYLPRQSCVAVLRGLPSGWAGGGHAEAQEILGSLWANCRIGS